MTEEQIKQFDTIPEDEIREDIRITQEEINLSQAELKVLKIDPVKNRLEIYIREGRILIRESFIERLNKILDYRKTKP